MYFWRELILTVTTYINCYKASQYHPRWEWNWWDDTGQALFRHSAPSYVQFSLVKCLLKRSENPTALFSRQEHTHVHWTSSTATATVSPWVILRNLPQVGEVCNSQHNFLLRKSFTFAVGFSSRLQWFWWVKGRGQISPLQLTHL